MNEGKILGLDYGDFTIGLALFDCKTKFTYPYKTIWREKANILRASIREIIDIIDKEEVSKIIVGKPINMDDTEGERVTKVNIFVKMLGDKVTAYNKVKNKSVSIVMQDERLSTIEAKEILSARGVKPRDMKKVLDQVAAEVILTDYLKGEKIV